MNNREIGIDLLNWIHKYYAVGTISFQSAYPGQKLISDIIANKISAVQLGIENAWQITLKTLALQWGNKLYNLDFQQLPSYAAAIDFHIIDNNVFDLERKIHLKLSLLCPYYTVFLEDRLTMKSYNDSGPIVIYYPYDNLKEDIKSQIDLIKACVESNFQDHTLIDPEILFKLKITGAIPYGLDFQNIEDSWPYYNYLFDNDSLDDIITKHKTVSSSQGPWSVGPGIKP